MARAESGGTAHLWNHHGVLGNARGLHSVEAFPQRRPEQTQGWPRVAETFDEDFPLLSLVSSSHILVAFLIMYRRHIYSPPLIGQVIDLSCTWLRHSLISPRWMTLTKGCDGTFIFWMHRSDTIATQFYTHTVGKTQIHLLFAIPGGRAECVNNICFPYQKDFCTPPRFSTQMVTAKLPVWKSPEVKSDIHRRRAPLFPTCPSEPQSFAGLRGAGVTPGLRRCCPPSCCPAGDAAKPQEQGRRLVSQAAHSIQMLLWLFI